jgi:hypothetical protein
LAENEREIQLLGASWRSEEGIRGVLMPAEVFVFISDARSEGVSRDEGMCVRSNKPRA